MEKLKTVDIKGKAYVMVNERVRYFNDNYPNGSIKTDIFSMEGSKVFMVARVFPDVANPERCFTGYSYEDETNGFINKTSYIENCETSAVGRALGFMGIGVDDSIATADEIANAIINQDKKEPSKNKNEAVSKKEALKKEYKKASEKQLREINHIISLVAPDMKKVNAYYKINSFDDCNEELAERIIKDLAKKYEEQEISTGGKFE